ncbi:MAG: acetate--CoA ligase family protein [Promethearchaeia archaeon]
MDNSIKIKQYYQSEQEPNKLQRLFYPQSIAVIGASNKEGKLGFNIFKNLKDQGYQGKLYPVNPSSEFVQGVESYNNILDINDQIDVAIIIIPAKYTPQAVKECCQKGVKFIINEVAGFSEIGEKGKEIEKEMKQIINNYDTRMVGPNCSGLINTSHHMIQSIGLVEDLNKGNVGLIGQAGVYAAGILWGLKKIMNFSLIVTVGNKLDLDETDFLEFIGNDKNTDVICMYLEDIKGGRKFIDVAKRITAKKPVITLKGGRTEKGSKTAASHTGSMAGNMRIYDAVFNQTGIIKAKDNRNMFNIAKAFSKQPLPKGPNVMIITYTGSMGVTGTDTCYENGLQLADLSKRSVEKLKAIMPEYVDAKNPADFTFYQSSEDVAKAIEICAYDPNIDAFIPIIQAENAHDYIRALTQLDTNNKPMLLCIPSMEFVMDSVIQFEKLGVPVYATVENTVKVLSHMYKFYLHKEQNL